MPVRAFSKPWMFWNEKHSMIHVYEAYRSDNVVEYKCVCLVCVRVCLRIVFMTFEIVGLRTCSQRCNMLAKFVIVCYLDIVLLTYGLY